jgi:hypothetical protein
MTQQHTKVASWPPSVKILFLSLPAREFIESPEHFLSWALAPRENTIRANAFEISDIQEAETEGALTRRSGFNNVVLR